MSNICFAPGNSAITPKQDTYKYNRKLKNAHNIEPEHHRSSGRLRQYNHSLKMMKQTPHSRWWKPLTQEEAQALVAMADRPKIGL